MKRAHNRLRHSIIVSFCLFATLLTICYGLFIFLGLKSMEDHFFAKQLKSITNQYIIHLQTNSPDTIRPLSLKTYLGTEKMPEPLFDLIGSFDNGIHELQFEVGGQEVELQFSVSDIPNSRERLYVVYDVSNIEISDRQEASFISLLVITGIIVAAMGITVGVIIANRVTKPISLLTERVGNWKEEQPPTDLVKGIPENEIYYLGKTLERANRRIQTFILREKEFTRNASHELRTPLTVIKGGVDILQDTDNCPKRPLDRIARSLEEMELTISTFLQLAREDNIQKVKAYDAAPVCKLCLEKLDFLTERKEVELTLEQEAPLQLTIPSSLLQILLGNLIRNSIRHTSKGKVTVIIRKDCFEVVDTGAGINNDLQGKITHPGVKDPHLGGTGFGLTIVEQICKRLDWQMKIQKRTDESGTCIRLGPVAH